VIAGLAFGAAASSRADEVTTHCRVYCNWTDWKSADGRGRSDATLEKIFVGLGIGAIAAGATFYYLGIRDEHMVAIAPAAGGAIVSWSRSW
jgi:hypothetical protein